MSLYFVLVFIQVFSIIISVPICSENSNFCSHCNILTNLCAKCEKQDILIPDKNGGCMGAKKCIFGKNFCYECDTEEKLCKVCEENYYPDNNGGCAYSEGCEISYLGECLQCMEGFVLIGKEKGFRFCKSLSIEIYKNCEEINYETGYCNKCSKGYYLTSGDSKCIKNENCKEAIIENCISCKEGYYLNKKENKCKLKKDDFIYCKQTMDDKKCEICDDGYYLDENGICVGTLYCLESENLICKKCEKGYYLSNNNICTNTEHCDFADKITSICTFCKDNYYLSTKDYKCRTNLENNSYKYCKKVDNNECVTCEVNYYLGEDSKCSNSQFCSESENGKCEICQKKYYLGLDNKCTNVKKCIYSSFGTCIECDEGYYYNKFNNTCMEMNEQFLNCKYTCEDGEKCCECKDDFYLFENNSLCYDNTKEDVYINCAFVENSKACNRCINGYYLGSKDKKCSKIENCKISENESKCYECDDYHCLDVKTNKCVDNDYLKNMDDLKYISCKRTNEDGTACEQCIYGYVPNEDGYCVDIDICEEIKGGKCLKCKDISSINGYKYCANELFGCLESVHDNCLRCDNLKNLYECTECKEGFIKNINGCVKDE